MPNKSTKSKCLHSSLVYHASPYQPSTSYTQPNATQLRAAATPRGALSSTVTNPQHTALSQSTFPAPLVLPDDDLAVGAKEPPQSVRSWSQEHHRNKVTAERRTIYVVSPPLVEDSLSFVCDWSKPRVSTGKGKGKKTAATGTEKSGNVDVNHVIGYLAAFYHGMPVKQLSPEEVEFTEWEESYAPPVKSRSKESKSKRVFIGLTTPSPAGPIKTRIRTRPTPEGDFPAQLNLNDILDAMISALPEDAYTIVMLVDHDLYEDDEDEFVCGRAYGGSRVAVISTARYDPALDRAQQIEREHAWPAAHCEAYVNFLCGEEDSEVVVKASRQKEGIARKYREEGDVIVIDSSDDENEVANKPGAIELAVKAHMSLPSLESSRSAAALAGLWLGRVCRTVAHEVGHCFGMGHCVYYACSMQGSASIIEDSRQPPYLCPVELAKILQATEGDMMQRYEALLSFLQKHRHTHLFASYAAWISHRLIELRG